MTATATTIASTIATTLAPPAPLGLQDPPHTATGQLHYGLRWIGSRCFLAADAPGGTRIVEAFGNVAEAEHIAVLVPGNGHNLGNYFTDKGPNSPSERGRLLLRAMRELDPGARCAVVVWVGYDAPANLASAADNRPAHHGAPDLVRLTQFLPSHAHITLVGHSYGTTVCGLHITHDNVIRMTLAHGAYRRHAFRKGQNRADLDDLDITGDAIGNIHGGSKIGRIQSNL